MTQIESLRLRLADRGQEHLLQFEARLSDPQRIALIKQIESLDLDLYFARGDEIRTEISAKFTPERLEAEFRAAGLAIEDLLMDGEGLYGLSLSRTGD